MTPAVWWTVAGGLISAIVFAALDQGLPLIFTVAVLPTLAAIIGPLLIRKENSPLNNAVFGVVYILIVSAIAVQYGGLAPGATPWLAAAPVFAAAYGKHASTYATWLVLVLAISGLALWSYAAGTSPYQNPGPELFMDAACTLGTAVILSLVGRYQSGIRDRALLDARNTTRSLALELDEHTKTRARLQQANQQALASAHAAGMAEIAIGVLHNIGNAINGVNVSASLTADRLLPKRAGELRRLKDVVEAEANRETLDIDRQRKVSQYLSQTIAKMQDQERQLRDEIQSLREGLDHVMVIVNTQQAYAQSRGLVHKVMPIDALGQALILANPKLTDSSVDLDVHLDALPAISVDQHKLVQILANLLSNAADAVAGTPSGSGQINIDGDVTDHAVVIRIRDSGTGIAPDALTRIFEHGFTTKESGNGFGLHISALAARALGGRLDVQSDGLGRGATFSLTLPRSGSGGPLIPALA